MVNHIYALAGNVQEWILEKANQDSSKPSVARGGLYGTYGNSITASARGNGETSYTDDAVGFRSTIY